MPAMNVSRSIELNASTESVFNTLNNLHTWSSWSPWLIMEPGVEVDVSEDGKYYEWNGDRVGSGNMKITGEKKNKEILYDLNFLKPLKSEAKVTFKISPKGEGSNVTWTMESAMPWYMFWMTGMMEGYISMDYDRGLNLLKDYIEKGELHSKLEFKGIENFSGTKYLGIKKTTSFDELGDVMKDDFGTLYHYLKELEGISNGKAFSIYHKWKVGKKEATFTSCIGVYTVPDNLPEGITAGEIPETGIYTLRHIGPYHHVGNAWSTLYSMQRGKEFKLNKKVDPFEVYVSDPEKTDPKDIITDVCFPVN